MPKKYDPVQVQRDHLTQLVGARIVAVDAEPDQFDRFNAWPVLHVELADGTRAALLIQQDPEGNGPGHVEVCR